MSNKHIRTCTGMININYSRVVSPGLRRETAIPFRISEIFSNFKRTEHIKRITKTGDISEVLEVADSKETFIFLSNFSSGAEICIKTKNNFGRQKAKNIF